ncbi:MAG: preprotein translocase subunit SecY, partial [Firmicutes bacterium]|nr:preprotein translocase subunit SecY [Bacillota bacterium]
MLQTMKQAWKIPEMRKKMLYTLMMMVVFRLGSNIPVPGINRALLTNMFDSNDAGLFGLFNLFSGGSFQNFTIFALSITPYITSSIILQLLTVAIPKLEELSKQGEEGRRKIAALTRYITIALALIQAIGYTFGLFGGVLSDDSILSKIVIVLCLIAGTTFLMWLGERINEKGIGNGISLIIFAGIVSRVPTTITSTFTKLSSGEASI